VRAAQHRVGLRIVQYLLLLRIPFEAWAVEAHGDVAKVAENDGGVGVRWSWDLEKPSVPRDFLIPFDGPGAWFGEFGHLYSARMR
jgi:hypothetical protein